VHQPFDMRKVLAWQLRLAQVRGYDVSLVGCTLFGGCRAVSESELP
jgi:hypothetical protein